jgi:hypothetical protein
MLKDNMSTIKIYTKDQNTIIAADAVKDDGTAWLQAEISLIRIIIRGPRNDTTQYAAVTATFGTLNAFTGIITGTLPTEGYWGIQFEYTLVSSGLPVYTKVFEEYVGATLVPL